MTTKGIAGEFVERPNRKLPFTVGTTFATALTGFIAGVITTFIVLYPWLYTIGKICPSTGGRP